MQLTRELLAKLAAPFPAEVIRWAPVEYDQTRTRVKVVPYVPDWAVMDRLDEVVGPAEWTFDFEVLPDGTTKGKLTICGVTKCSRGSTTRDAGVDVSFGWKARADTAVSLTGAAVLFGIGRDLRRMGPRWVDCDPETGEFTPPVLGEGDGETIREESKMEELEDGLPGATSDPKTEFWKLASEALKAGVSHVRIQQIAASGDWEAAIQALREEMEKAAEKPQGKMRETADKRSRPGHKPADEVREGRRNRLSAHPAASAMTGGTRYEADELPF